MFPPQHPVFDSVRLASCFVVSAGADCASCRVFFIFLNIDDDILKLESPNGQRNAAYLVHLAGPITCHNSYYVVTVVIHMSPGVSACLDKINAKNCVCLDGEFYRPSSLKIICFVASLSRLRRLARASSLLSPSSDRLLVRSTSLRSARCA